MPIYEYRCSACGFQNEYLQKASEKPLTKCPSCAKQTFTKQLSAAGFQLKGSGWYQTDFRHGGAKKSTDKKADAKADAKGEAKSEAKSDAKSEAKSESSTASTTN